MSSFRSARSARLASLSFAIATLSCSVVIDTKTKQCDVDADCKSLGKMFANAVCEKNVCVNPQANGPMGCTEPAPAATDTVQLSFGLSFTAAPPKPSPFSIRACAPLDPDCTSPVGGPVRVNYGDIATIDVPVGFQGVIEVTTPDGVPALEFLGRPILQDTHGYDLVLPTPTALQSLFLVTNQQYDANAGILIVTTRDCDRQPLANVQVTNSGGGLGFYFQRMLPQQALTETTTEGSAGFVNVPAGLVAISATRNGRPLTGNSAVSRAGWITYAEIFP